ncbi:hypothetical protein BST61_g2506 [Cercospora zeina]
MSSPSATTPAIVDTIVDKTRMAHDKLVVEEADDYDYESLPPNFSLAANMAAGAFAGIAEHSVMYPIDLLKTRMQVVNPTPAAVYTGIGNAIATISRAEGGMALWRGVSSVVVGAGPAHAVYFATYEVVKQAMGGNASGHHPIAAASSGACATIASDAFMNPFDVIKQRMQLHGSTHRTIVDCARQVWRTEGIRAFYVSYPTTLAMTVPFTALQFTVYESLTKQEVLRAASPQLLQHRLTLSKHCCKHEELHRMPKFGIAEVCGPLQALFGEEKASMDSLEE